MKVSILQLEKIIKELHTVADELKGKLPEDYIYEFRVDIDNNEIGVGLERFLIQIDESDVILSEEAYKKLKRISKAFVEDEGILKIFDD